MVTLANVKLYVVNPKIKKSNRDRGGAMTSLGKQGAGELLTILNEALASRG